MNGNQINLFKYKYNNGRYSNYSENGDWRWGTYISKDNITHELTGYVYYNYYLFEVRRGW